MKKYTDLKMPNEILENFMRVMVEELEKENNINLFQIDIPWILSTLFLDMRDNSEEYQEFLTDLKQYRDWYVCDVDDTSETYLTVKICLSEEVKTYYEFDFNVEERHWEYCQCTPDMPDYREDKLCCGHGCDADFCSVVLTKKERITQADWEGDEANYWDFEEAFKQKYFSNVDKVAKMQESKENQEVENAIANFRRMIETNAETGKILVKLFAEIGDINGDS